MKNIIDNFDSKCITTVANKKNNNSELDIEVVHPSGAIQGHHGMGHGNTSLQLLTT